MILRTRHLVTMDAPPIEDGAVIVRGDSIEAAGRWRDLLPEGGGDVIDLGERILMPGLINAHCHLDYTMLRNVIARPGSFTQWIQRINALKRTMSDDDYLRALAAGYDELKKWGTTTVFNLEAFPELLTKIPPPPVRTWWFYEMIDLRHRVPTDELFAGALSFFEGRSDWIGGFGLSPHAPYTASRTLYRLANDCARLNNMPLTTHLAESAEETDMFRRRSGPLFSFLQSLGRDMNDCGNGSPLAAMERDGILGDHWILAHMNQLDAKDFALLETARPHIVHCPRSHEYFRHPRFEFRRLHEAGLNICLGTDSLASNDSLNLFAEMQTLQRTEPWLSAEALVRLVTRNPARALGLDQRLGRVSPGAWADLIALPFQGSSGGIFEAIVDHQKPIDWMMINGKIKA